MSVTFFLDSSKKPRNQENRDQPHPASQTNIRGLWAFQYFKFINFFLKPTQTNPWSWLSRPALPQLTSFLPQIVDYPNQGKIIELPRGQDPKSQLCFGFVLCTGHRGPTLDVMKFIVGAVCIPGLVSLFSLRLKSNWRGVWGKTLSTYLEL